MLAYMRFLRITPAEVCCWGSMFFLMLPIFVDGGSTVRQLFNFMPFLLVLVLGLLVMVVLLCLFFACNYRYLYLLSLTIRCTNSNARSLTLDILLLFSSGLAYCCSTCRYSTVNNCYLSLLSSCYLGYSCIVLVLDSILFQLADMLGVSTLLVLLSMMVVGYCGGCYRMGCYQSYDFYCPDIDIILMVALQLIIQTSIHQCVRIICRI